MLHKALLEDLTFLLPPSHFHFTSSTLASLQFLEQHISPVPPQDFFCFSTQDSFLPVCYVVGCSASFRSLLTWHLFKNTFLDHPFKYSCSLLSNVILHSTHLDLIYYIVVTLFLHWSIEGLQLFRSPLCFLGLEERLLYK